MQHSTSQYIIINFAHASTLNMPPKKRGRYSGSRELKIFSDIKTLALWFIFGDIKGVAKPRGFREEGFKCPGGARKRHKRRSRNDRAFMSLEKKAKKVSQPRTWPPRVLWDRHARGVGTPKMRRRAAMAHPTRTPVGFQCGGRHHAPLLPEYKTAK